MQPIVLYVLAASRSGSTLLERLIAQSPAATAAGELVHLWTRGLRDDEPCGCGVAFSACSHWIDVGVRAFGGWERIDPVEAITLQSLADRQRYMPSLLYPLGTRKVAIRRYAERLSGLYRAISLASGARVVVDSSKHASTALLLRHVSGVEGRIVHLVRDPLGVASSWSRQTYRPETADRPMHQVSVARATARWAGRNLQAELVSRVLPTHRMRYEDLVDDPVAALSRLIDDLELPIGLPTITTSGLVQLATDHTVAGNPMRFTTGDVKLSADERWRKDLNVAQQQGIAFVTWPLRRAYSYTMGPSNG